MKRVRCPQCGTPVVFDESLRSFTEPMRLQCTACGKQFALRPAPSFGTLTVIENRFHYKQELPLRLGDNTIGRYQKANPITSAIHTDDPSVDLLHCIVNVSRQDDGTLRYVLRDANSNTGTFVGDTEILPRERCVIADGTLFTIGATSIILKEP